MRFLKGLLVLTVLGSAACVATAPERNLPNVPPGKIYRGSYINITAPNSEGWHLLESSGRGMAFARGGTSKNESFAASVVMFNLPQTTSPEEFEALIVREAGRDLETSRFTTREFSHHYSASRGYPCVEVHNVSEDREAQTEQNKTEALVMTNEQLYCRHPIRTNTGFAITYSHRGSNPYPNLQDEAQAFIRGVQVPDN